MTTGVRADENYFLYYMVHDFSPLQNTQNIIKYNSICNFVKLSPNYKSNACLLQNFGKPSNTWRLKNILLKNEWVNQEVKKLKKNTWKQMKMKT